MKATKEQLRKIHSRRSGHINAICPSWFYQTGKTGEGTRRVFQEEV